MNNYKSLFIYGFIFLYFGNLCHANKQQDIEQLLKYSGFIQQMNTITHDLKQNIKQASRHRALTDQKKLDNIYSTIDNTIQISEIIAQAKDNLDKALTKQQLSQLIGWYHSDVYKKIQSEKEKNSHPKKLLNMYSEKNKLFSNTERLTWAFHVEQLTKISDFVIQKQTNSLKIVSTSIAYLKKKNGFDEVWLKKYIASNMSGIQSKTPEMILLNLLYTYKGLTADELKQYKHFLEKEETKLLNQTLKDSITQTFEEMTLHFAKKVRALAKVK